MRHRKAGRKLGRNASHRLALYRNLTMSLIRHERIITTLEKAKAVRPFVEKLITLAKKGTLHARRLAIARLGPSGIAAVKPDEGKKDETPDMRRVLVKLFDDIGPRFKDRPGGYTRIIKRHERRLGDAGRTAFLELLKEGEVKVKAKAAKPAPRIEEEEEQQAEQEAQPQEAQPSATAPAEEKKPEESEPKA
ncbi:MAG: 50S ribosomal protein L17 [Planctomycetes bacterium]|nr:50S ribosomal protein L17 [Planctomycetota bacterium]